MNKKILSLVLLLVFFSLSSFAAESKILMVVADNLSRDWISAYGSVNKTPAIDKLAANGLRFTTAWQTSTDKKKAEKNFLTGSYKSSGVPFPALLEKAGYKTYYFGSANSSTLLNNATTIKQAGYKYYSINSGKVKNVTLKDSLAKSVMTIMKKKQKSLVCVRFSSNQAKTKEEQVKHVARVDKFIADIAVLTKVSAPVTIILTAVSGTTLHAKVNPKNKGKKTKRNPFAKGNKHKKESFAVRDVDIRLPLIVKSPLIPENGLFTKDLIDATDFAPTLVDLAGLKSIEKGNSKSFKPAITGTLDPLVKKNWIFCDAGKDKVIRSWHYMYYANDRIYGINSDPEQKLNLMIGKNNDKHYAGERVRLKMIYERDILGIQVKKGSLIKIETLEK